MIPAKFDYKPAQSKASSSLAEGTIKMIKPTIISDKNKNRFENVNQLEKVNESYLPNYLVENYEKYKSLID